MRNKLFFLLLVFNIVFLQANDNHRLILFADMCNEPDEVQQMIHMITCSNELDIEGLIAVTGKYLRPELKDEFRRVTHPELLIEIIDAYTKDLFNFKKKTCSCLAPQVGEIYNNNYVPVWRWREAMYNDQICLMDRCSKLFEEANHHPVAAIDRDKSNSMIRISALSGEVLSFDASASTDPYGDQLIFNWWIYPEAGTYPGQVWISDPNKDKTTISIPTGAGNKQIHLILEVKDDNAIASLFDYRRIVIDVENIIVKQESIQVD